MSRVDCGTYEDALCSLRELFGTSDEGLKEFFGQYDPLEDYDVDIVAEFEEVFGEPGEVSDIVFYHGSRLPSVLAGDSNPFIENGLLPLAQACEDVLGYIYDACSDIISEEQWEAFKAQFLASGAYLGRLNSDEGPYGVLTAYALFEGAGFHGAYADDAGDLVEDVCRALEDEFEVDGFYERFMESTIGVVVAFRVENFRFEGAVIQDVINYSWRCFHGVDIHPPYMCYDGRGEAVHSEDLLAVEFV